MKLSKKQAGLTLVELMISITIASILSLAVMSLFASQSSTFVNQSRTSQARVDGRDIYTVLSSLLRQSQNNNIAITSTPSDITVDLTLPAGYPIWPNTTAPYTNNAVRLSWSNTGLTPNQLSIASASAIANLGAATPIPLIGDNTGNNTRITGFNLSSVSASNSYLLSVTSQAGNLGTGATFEGIVIPRN